MQLSLHRWCVSSVSVHTADRQIFCAEPAAKATTSSSNVLPVEEGLAKSSTDALPPNDGGGRKPTSEGRKDLEGPEAVLARGGDPDAGCRSGKGHESADPTAREGVAPLHAIDGVPSAAAQCLGDARTEGQANEGVHVAKKAKLSGGSTKNKDVDQEKQTVFSPGTVSADTKGGKGQQNIKSFFTKADKGGKG